MRIIILGPSRILSTFYVEADQKNDHVSAYFASASEGRYEREERLQKNQGDDDEKEPNGIKEG